jgi:NADH:ubiquinone oxidoreductase subunit F (NADH-binding)
VQNPETLAHVALIARHGPAWFREAGTPHDPGTALVTVSGAVARPGVLEIAHGDTLTAVLARVGGVTERRRAVLVGGFHGTWLAADVAEHLALDARSLAHHDATLAAGVVFVLGESSCPVGEVASIVGWLAGQSAGQCGPCANGLPAVASELARIADGRGRTELVLRWAGQLGGRGACHLPDGVVRLVRSALDAFAPEFADHERHGPCALCDRPRALARAA